MVTTTQIPGGKDLYAIGSYIFKTEFGKKFLEELRKRYLDVSIWNQTDSKEMIYYKEGQRQLILKFVEMYNYEPK
jgi:hypothetical protein